MKVLVTGNVGYIGSTTTQHLIAAGHEVIGLDIRERGGHRIPGVQQFTGSVGDKRLLETLPNFDAVIHFAGLVAVADSFLVPERYFEVNVAQSMSLLAHLLERGTNRLIFSSSAAVYDALDMPLNERDALRPVSPYGESKRMFEEALRWVEGSTSLRYVALRYFNAAGCLGEFYENHEPETHLIPRALEAAKHGAEFTIFGNKYRTGDGTCVRDYVHVNDVAKAHVAALDYLGTGKSTVVNIGSGRGSSNLEVIEAVEQVTGKKMRVQFGPARLGDPAYLVADISKADSALNWRPLESELLTIVEDAWRGHQR